MSISRKKPLVRLEDVAREAGVSIATVSLALRNDASVAEATRQRVHDATRQLGYRTIRKRHPFPAANDTPLRSECHRLLYAMVNDPLQQTRNADFLEGVMDRAQQEGIRLELRHFHAEDPATDWEALRDEADAVILTGAITPGILAQARALNKRLILLGNDAFPGVIQVGPDLFEAGQALGRRAAQDGARKVFHLSLERGLDSGRALLMGLRNALELHPQPVALAQHQVIGDLFDAVHRAARQILDQPPEEIAVTSDSLAVAEACLSELRHLVPKATPLPACYALSTSPQERASSHLKILMIDARRCGQQAVDLARQLCLTPIEHPLRWLLPPFQWR